jgi:isopenicillin N synthase-like dioxygenase
MLTILKTGEEGGLQLSLDGDWIDIKPIPGTFVCNIGALISAFCFCFLCCFYAIFPASA